MDAKELFPGLRTVGESMRELMSWRLDLLLASNQALEAAWIICFHATTSVPYITATAEESSDLHC